MRFPTSMKVKMGLALGCLGLLTALAASGPKVCPERWVYVTTGLGSDQELARVEGIARTAAAHGLNGMVLSGVFGALDLKSSDCLERLQHLKQTSDQLKVEIIPLGFDVGTGGGVLEHDKNLAAGLPVHGALFVAGDTEAHFVADPPVKLLNGGFEQVAGTLPAGFTMHGSRAVIDTSVSHSGKASVRFEDFGKTHEGEVYLAQPLRVHPYRCYRLHVWVKTQGVPHRALFHLWAIAPDGRDLAYLEPWLPVNGDWQELVWAFNSWYADRVDFRIGVSEGAGITGTVWADDVRVEEVGLTNVLRRRGTPVKVRNEKTGEVYQEGRDFASISDPQLNFRWDHEGPAIRLLPGSRIHAGDRLRVDYFHGTAIYRDKVTIDMSEPAVYETWQRQIPLIEKYLAPKKYFLSMDEVRIGGFCDACQNRHISMAQILGDCVAREEKMIRAANPQAEIYIWSDMFDPNHNAHEEYYLIDGSFEGTWYYLPKDLVIACWHYDKRDLSLDFYSKRGYRTLAAAYYDADNLENPKGWLESLRHTPGAIGIMYTTWKDKYQLLPAFGDLVSTE